MIYLTELLEDTRAGVGPLVMGDEGVLAVSDLNSYAE
jgi:hypothetical protein